MQETLSPACPNYCHCSGLSWGLAGVFNWDLLSTAIFGVGSAISRLIYIVVGLSALWLLFPLFSLACPSRRARFLQSNKKAGRERTGLPFAPY